MGSERGCALHLPKPKQERHLVEWRGGVDLQDTP